MARSRPRRNAPTAPVVFPGQGGRPLTDTGIAKTRGRRNSRTMQGRVALFGRNGQQKFSPVPGTRILGPNGQPVTMQQAARKDGTLRSNHRIVGRGDMAAAGGGQRLRRASTTTITGGGGG